MDILPCIEMLGKREDSRGNQVVPILVACLFYKCEDLYFEGCCVYDLCYIAGHYVLSNITTSLWMCIS